METACYLINAVDSAKMINYVANFNNVNCDLYVRFITTRGEQYECALF